MARPGSWPELTLRAFRVALGQPELDAGADFMDAGGDSLRRTVMARKAEARVWYIPEGAGSLPLSRWRDFKKVPGVLRARIPLDTRTSLYARYGDWFAGSCLGVLGLLCGCLLVTRRPLA